MSLTHFVESYSITRKYPHLRIEAVEGDPCNGISSTDTTSSSLFGHLELLAVEDELQAFYEWKSD